MNKSFSIYLDLVRFLAAVLVYVYHSNQRWLTHEVLPLSNYGHSAVIVFFVLSGYVIAHVTATKEKDWASYAASRIARVYSVVVPALVLGLLLDFAGRQINAAPYSSYPFDQIAVRLAASFLMLNEVWTVSITTLSNVPYWSIGFESWYYLLFGLVSFVPGRKRWFIAAALLIGLGPKIALLAPLWLLGVLLHRWQRLKALPFGWALTLALASTLGIVAVHQLGTLDSMNEWLREALGSERHKQLTFAKFFVGDYLLGLLVFAHFAALRVVAPACAGILLKIEKPVRAVAAHTFTLYLTHQPLFLFWGVLLAGDATAPSSWWLCTACVAASVWLIGELTEKRRAVLRTWLYRRLNAVQGLSVRVSA